MKRIKSALCAVLFTLTVYSNAFAGIIYGVSRDGIIYGRDGIIYGVVNGVWTAVGIVF